MLNQNDNFESTHLFSWRKSYDRQMVNLNDDYLLGFKTKNLFKEHISNFHKLPKGPGGN